jgi:hypothetical protein
VTTESIAAELGLKRVGRTWRGACLLCGGSNRLQVRDGHTRPLVWCWGGCERKAILAELKQRGLWAESNLTPEQKRDFAKQRARDERDLIDARRFADAAHVLTEALLEDLDPWDLDRGPLTTLLAALRTDTGMLATFRDWRSAHPEMTRALVRAGARHRRRVETMLEDYLEVRRNAA